MSVPHINNYDARIKHPLSVIHISYHSLSPHSPCAMFFLGRRGALFVRIAWIVLIPLCMLAGLILYVTGAARWGLIVLVFVSVLLCVHWPFLIDHIGDSNAGRSLPVLVQQPAQGTEAGPSHAELPANGLGASASAALPAYVYDKKAGGDDECAVCLGELQRGEVVKQLLACMHLFHDGCINTWLRSRITCPVCQSPVNAALPVAAQIMVRAQ